MSQWTNWHRYGGSTSTCSSPRSDYALYHREQTAPPTARELEAATEALARACDKYGEMAAETADADACRMLFKRPEDVVEFQRSNTPMSHALCLAWSSCTRSCRSGDS